MTESIRLIDKFNLFDNGSLTQRGDQFETLGDVQRGGYVLSNLTTDNVLTELFLDGTNASERLVLPSDSVWRFTITITARRINASNGSQLESAAYEVKGCVDKRFGPASIEIVGTVSYTITAEDQASWDVLVDADQTNGSLRIRVQGENSKTIRWVAFMDTTEVIGNFEDLSAPSVIAPSNPGNAYRTDTYPRILGEVSGSDNGGSYPLTWTVVKTGDPITSPLAYLDVQATNITGTTGYLRCTAQPPIGDVGLLNIDIYATDYVGNYDYAQTFTTVIDAADLSAPSFDAGNTTPSLDTGTLNPGDNTLESYIFSDGTVPVSLWITDNTDTPINWLGFSPTWGGDGSNTTPPPFYAALVPVTLYVDQTNWPVAPAVYNLRFWAEDGKGQSGFTAVTVTVT